MKKFFLLVSFLCIFTMPVYSFEKIEAGIVYDYTKQSLNSVYIPDINTKLPALNKAFVNLGYFIKYTPLNLLSSNDLYYIKKKNKNLTPISPMASTPSVYNIALNTQSSSASGIKNIEQLVKENPNRPEFLYGLALQYKKEQKYNLAVQTAQKALNINPTYALGHFLMGDILRETGNYKEATREYLATIEINPYCTDAYFNIGKIMELYNRNDIALNYYKMAYSTNPKDIEIRNIIIKLEKNLG